MGLCASALRSAVHPHLPHHMRYSSTAPRWSAQQAAEGSETQGKGEGIQSIQNPLASSQMPDGQIALKKGAAGLDGDAVSARGVAVPPVPVTSIDICGHGAAVGKLVDLDNGPSTGLPYQAHYLGPPIPPCEAERLVAARALGRIDGPEEDPEICSILRLCSSIFSAPASMCALFDDKRVFVSEAAGGVIPHGHFPWRWSLCGWSLAFKNAQILVIPDAHLDSRFVNNLKVAELQVRFYCGAPLVASNGHRLGTLCFADTKPRQFDQASCIIMNNLSELVVRQLERGLAIKANTKDNSDMAAATGHLQRTLDAYEHCILLLDVSNKGAWKVLYCNAELEKLTGIDRAAAVGGTLQDLFEDAGGGSMLPAALVEAVAANKKHRCWNARLKSQQARPGTPHSFVLGFRPAAKEHLDDHVVQIGIPTFLPISGAADGSGDQQLYFVTVDRGTARTAFNSRCSLDSSRMPETTGLELGHSLGKGALGSVYYGTWFGSPVAVKIINSDASQTASLLEAVLSNRMKHPYILSTLKYFHRTLKGGALGAAHDSGSSLSAPQQHAHLRQSAGCRHSWTLTPHKPEAKASGWSDVLNSGPAFTGAIDWREAGSSSMSRALPDGFDTSNSNAEAVMLVMPMDAVGDGEPHKPAEYERLAEGPWKAASPQVRRLSTDRTGPDRRQMVLVMEYCDRGNLQDALDRGWLLRDKADVSKGPNMDAVMATAAEVAAALMHLHAHSVVHGDLSGWSVMLSSSGSSAAVGNRSFVAKVADFGLARALGGATEMVTKSYGTLTHQPPETLTQGIVSRSTDTYSFGVLLWQMFCGSRPWAGLTHAQVVEQVCHQGAKLRWPPATPPGFRSLAEACMQREAAARPAFDDIVRRLEGLRSECVSAADITLEGEWS